MKTVRAKRFLAHSPCPLLSHYRPNTQRRQSADYRLKGYSVFSSEANSWSNLPQGPGRSPIVGGGSGAKTANAIGLLPLQTVTLWDFARRSAWTTVHAPRCGGRCLHANQIRGLSSPLSKRTTRNPRDPNCSIQCLWTHCGKSRTFTLAAGP